MFVAKRKLRKVGDSFVLTIPRNAIIDNTWTKGEKLMLEEKNGYLKVYSQTNLSDEGFETVFTIGYEGKDPEMFVKSLSKAGVTQLIDVRDMPLSRKKGFSKTALKTLLSKAGIVYRHIRNLGAPSYLRKEVLFDEGYSEFFKQYKQLLSTKTDAVDLLEAYSRARASAIMCFERKADTCHRSILAAELKKRGFQIKNL